MALVLTQPDRPAGRGLEPRPSAVKQLALASGIPVAEPQTLRGPVADIERVRALAPDALVVAAPGLLLPPALLEVGRHGAFNIHASLLPRWRGAAPIQRAILAGDADTGISIMQMDTGLDTGAIVLQRRVAIDADGRRHASRQAGRARRRGDRRCAGIDRTRSCRGHTTIDWRRDLRTEDRQAGNAAPMVSFGLRLERAVRAFGHHLAPSHYWPAKL